MTEFKTLDGVTRAVITDTFNDAFSEYQISVDMTEAKLDRMIRERSVRLDHSFGLFDGDVLAGFVLTGSRRLDGVLTAYDAGTGIRQRYQGRGYGAELLTKTVDRLRDLGYQRYLLEVLQGNDRAVALYRRHGFEVTRELNCFRKTVVRDTMDGDDRKDGDWKDGGAVDIAVERGWRERYSLVPGCRPSWQNSAEAIEALGAACRLVKVPGEGCTRAWAAVAVDTGSLMQIAGTDIDALRAVVTHAEEIVAGDELKVINLPASCTEMETALKELGFERFVSQYEMERDLHRYE